MGYFLRNPQINQVVSLLLLLNPATNQKMTTGDTGIADIFIKGSLSRIKTIIIKTYLKPDKSCAII